MMALKEGAPSRIHKLSDEVANQIAAGEVVERPASVIKELLENALDAGALQVTVRLNYGGLNLIEVSDDGVGMVAEDLPLTIVAHATSKVATLQDLYAINTMGFRGEALASIASVARVEITTRQSTAPHASRLYLNQNGQYQVEPVARAIGTTVSVADLFYNAPVRKKFLKSERAEYLYCEAVVKRFAMSSPHIALTLIHNEECILKLQAAHSKASIAARIAKLMGQKFVKEAIEVHVERAGMTLQGWLGHPHEARSQNDRMWVYLNGRMVKDKLINHAMKQAYEPWIHPGRYPSCLLYLQINPSDVDVNVHPTKHEVRFCEPRLVHDFLTSQVQQGLSALLEATTAAPMPAHKASLASSFGSKREQVPASLNPQWWVLDENHALYRDETASTYLVDVATVFGCWLRAVYTANQHKLTARPLLVPVVMEVQEDSARVLSGLLSPMETANGRVLSALQPFGFEIFLKPNEMTVHSFPSLTPQIDLAAFWADLLRRLALPFRALDECVFESMKAANSLSFAATVFYQNEELRHFLKDHLSQEEPVDGVRALVPGFWKRMV